MTDPQTPSTPAPSAPEPQKPEAEQTQATPVEAEAATPDVPAIEEEAAAQAEEAVQAAPVAEDTEAVNAELEQAVESGDVDAMLEEALTQAPDATDASEANEEKKIANEFRRGRVAAVRGDDVFIDLMTPEADGKKLQGVVPSTQFDRAPRIGAIMDFLVDRIAESEGLIYLNREGAVQHATWERIERGAVVEARVTGSNKGGLELEMPGQIRAFMPASQVDLHHIDDLEQFVGQRVEARVHEVDRKHKRVIISRREHLQKQRDLYRAKTLSELEVDQIREGTISNLTDFGAFVDLGGVDGLVHVTDLSHTHVKKPSDVVKVGDPVRVKVLKLDKDKGRISLGLKQVAPDPWEEHTFSVGDDVSGRITRTANFGAFVEVAEGVEGLLPMSEMSWKRIGKAEEVVQKDQVVSVKVIAVDLKKRRLTLSLKQAAGNPWAEAESEFAKGALVEGTVVSTTDFGAFIELKPGVEGMVHISELSTKRVNVVTDVLKVGQAETFRVIGLDTQKHKIKLSLKQVKEMTEEKAPVDNRPAVKRLPKSQLKGGMGGGFLGTGLGDLKL